MYMRAEHHPDPDGRRWARRIARLEVVIAIAVVVLLLALVLVV